VTGVGVLAHSAKTLGGGLEELRKTLATNGISDPMWCEVPKSRFVPEQVEKLLKEGVELIFVWGGDGTVQRVIDAVAGVPVALAILPAGTANLFATNLRIPKDLEEAVKIGLNGDQRQLDVGLINREHFGVMAGTGLDALMIRDADAGLKDKVGRFAYVWTGAKNVRKASVKMRIEVDGTAWFKGKASCLLIGNVGDVIGRSVIGDAAASPFVETTTGRAFDVRLSKAVPYEIDGGVRKKTKRLKVKVEPGAITVCVPREEAP